MDDLASLSDVSALDGYYVTLILTNKLEFENNDDILKADEVDKDNTMLETDDMLGAEEADEDNTMLKVEDKSDYSE